LEPSGREQILWSVEGCRREEIELAIGRRSAKSADASRAGPPTAGQAKQRPFEQRALLVDAGEGSFGVLEDAALEMPEAPGDLSVPVSVRFLRRRRCLTSVVPTPAARTVGGSSAAGRLVSVIDERFREPVPTWSTLPRASASLEDGRERDTVGRKIRKMKRPSSSETANAVVAPSADTTAPLRGSPRSSLTRP
jgi:hypothetical protein